jgi:hypothetical protein
MVLNNKEQKLKNNKLLLLLMKLLEVTALLPVDSELKVLLMLLKEKLKLLPFKTLNNNFLMICLLMNLLSKS